MRKKLLHIFLAMTLLIFLRGISLAEQGYFPERKFVRPRMEICDDYLWTVEPFERVSYTPVNEKWGQVVSADGLSNGYLFIRDILPMPAITPCEPSLAYSEIELKLISLPYAGAPAEGVLPPVTCCRITGTLGDWVFVTLQNGVSGFARKEELTEAVFEPQPISPITFLVDQPVTGSSLPLEGADALGTLHAGKFYTAEQTWGSWLAISEENILFYIPRNAVRRCDDPEHFFALVEGTRKGPAVRGIYANAVVREDTLLRYADGKSTVIPSGKEIFVYETFGGFASVASDTEKGYLPESELQIMTGEALQKAIQKKDLSGASITRNTILDEAFSLLEEANPFTARYNLITGADVLPLMRLGIPYFWGGRNLRASMERSPLYTTREAWQSSPVYYKKGKIYAYGLDCVGFAKVVYKLAGHTIETTVEDLMSWRFCNAGYHPFCSAEHPLPEDWARSTEELRPGDVLVVHHPGLHVMIYIGTLRDYGYTAEDLPYLKNYLDYPLMIHCGENPYYYLRFSALIAGTDDERMARANPPDGGVSICILGVEPSQAQMDIQCGLGSWPCFDVEGSCVTVFDFSAVSAYCFWRDKSLYPNDGDPRNESITGEGHEKNSLHRVRVSVIIQTAVE